jgi:hypothetical protein
VVTSRCGAIQEQRRGDACRSTVMQTASTESKQNGACPMLHSFKLFHRHHIDAVAAASAEASGTSKLFDTFILLEIIIEYFYLKIT